MRKWVNGETAAGLNRSEVADLTSLSIVKIGIATVGMLSIALLLTVLS
jgi:hypothetical protein